MDFSELIVLLFKTNNSAERSETTAQLTRMGEALTESLFDLSFLALGEPRKAPLY